MPIRMRLRLFTALRARRITPIVARCMGIYTLHMGAMGNATVCQGGFLYPQPPSNSPVIEYLHNLDLFPEPCPTCGDRVCHTKTALARRNNSGNVEM